MKKLISLANVLDLSGQYNVANKVDKIILKASKIEPTSKTTREFDLNKDDPNKGKVKITCKDKEKKDFASILEEAKKNISDDDVQIEGSKEITLKDLLNEYMK